MKEIYPGLWQTSPDHPIADAPEVTTHAYLWVREKGNILFYNSARTEDYDRIEQLGGIAHQYLSHQDEVGPSLRLIRDRFGPELRSHILEQAATEEFAPVDRVFDQRESPDTDIEIIPTPGHTPGSVSFRIRHGGRRFLFTGDTLYRGADGLWHNGYIEGMSDRKTLEQSLRWLRNAEPDVVISSASMGGHAFQEIGGADWKAAVDGAIEALSAAVETR